MGAREELEMSDVQDRHESGASGEVEQWSEYSCGRKKLQRGQRFCVRERLRRRRGRTNRNRASMDSRSERNSCGSFRGCFSEVAIIERVATLSCQTHRIIRQDMHVITTSTKRVGTWGESFRESLCVLDK